MAAYQWIADGAGDWYGPPAIADAVKLSDGWEQPPTTLCRLDCLTDCGLNMPTFVAKKGLSQGEQGYACPAPEDHIRIAVREKRSSNPAAGRTGVGLRLRPPRRHRVSLGHHECVCRAVLR